MDPSGGILELLGLCVCVVGWVCSLTTTLMPQWLTLSTALLPAESYELGLWGTCVVQELGVMECSPYDGLLGLPSDIRLARVLMCAAMATGLLALGLAVPGMHVVNSCRGTETLRAKRLLRMLAGITCLGTALLGVVPVSYVAHLTVLRFFDESVPEVVPRWELGQALFWGWGAGLLHLAAGLLLVCSCVCVHDQDCPAERIPHTTTHTHPVTGAQRNHRKHTDYV